MAFGIAELRAHLDQQFKQVFGKLEDLERLVNDVPTDADLQTALANFQTVVVQAVTDANARVQADIAALKAQIAAGGTVSQADLDAVAAAQAATLTGIANIDPANPTPPPAAKK